MPAPGPDLNTDWHQHHPTVTRCHLCEYEQRIAELEQERDDLDKTCRLFAARSEGLEQRIAELERERDDWKRRCREAQQDHARTLHKIFDANFPVTPLVMEMAVRKARLLLGEKD